MLYMHLINLSISEIGFLLNEREKAVWFKGNEIIVNPSLKL